MLFLDMVSRQPDGETVLGVVAVIVIAALIAAVALGVRAIVRAVSDARRKKNAP